MGNRLILLCPCKLGKPRWNSWEHGKHRHLSRAASRLRAETGDRDVYRFFSVANDLHGNFYENEMSAEDIAESLDDVQALLHRLETLLKQV